MERTEHILIRVSPDEKQDIKEKADNNDLSMSEFIRKQALNHVNTQTKSGTDSVNTQDEKQEQNENDSVNTLCPYKDSECKMYVADNKYCGDKGKKVINVTQCSGPYK